MTIPAGGACPPPSATPCWKGRGAPPGSRGWRYRDRAATAGGVESLQLQPGAAGAAKITLKARGPSLVLPTLPLAVPLRVQLSAEGAACWEARYETGGVARNDSTRFTAASE